nr:hypothetical protein [uncultured Cupriavidus sp.]
MHALMSVAPAAAQGRAAVRSSRQQVLLRHWGFSNQEAASLLPDLPDLGGRLAWAVDAQHMGCPDLVVHLVDATRLSGVFGGARWNAMGPVDAMGKAYRRGASEIALVLGSIHHLPQRRYGCWVLSGANSLASSLAIMARTMIEPMLKAPQEKPWSAQELARMNALCVLSSERGSNRDTVGRRLTAAVATALHASLVTPARIVVAAEMQVMECVVSLNPLMRERMCLWRRPSSAADLSAEMLVAYPWPMSHTADSGH